LTKRVVLVSPRLAAVACASSFRGLHVEPLFDGDAFDVLQLRRRGRRLRQVRRQAELRVLAPQAEQAGELFARGHGLLAGARQGRAGFRVEDLFARQVQLAHVAGPGHAPGQFGAGLGGGVDLARVLQRLGGGHRLDPGDAGGARMLLDLARDLQPDLLEAPRLQRGRQRRRQQLDQVDGKGPLDDDVAAAGRVLEAQHRIGQPARLGQVGLGDAHLPVAGLQAGMRQHRDLHGVVHAERRGQHGLHRMRQLARGGIVAGQARFAPVRSRAMAATVKAAIRRDRRAAAQQGQRQRHRGANGSAFSLIASPGDAGRADPRPARASSCSCKAQDAQHAILHCFPWPPAAGGVHMAGVSDGLACPCRP
jgi:hypothetical protein